MPIDPQAKALGEALGADLDVTTLDLPTARAAIDAQARAGPRPPIGRVRDLRIPGPGGEIPLRLYAPEMDEPAPGLVYFHGGGWALCSIETHDVTCRQLAAAAGCVIASVDYRLAPEHPYPAAAEDAYCAAAWVVEHGAEIGVDPTRIGVGGDSAGGNLAAVVALMARDRGGPALRHQLLVYPITDCGLDTPSYRENAAGPLLTRKMMEAFWGFYAPDASRAAEPYASPLQAGSHAGLPPACVLTAECDPLRDEGEAYARRLADAGVPVVQRRYAGMIHGFFAMTDALEAAREALDDASRELRRALVA